MNYTVHRKGKFRADKILFKDGIGCCVWTPLGDIEDDDDVGLCYDFNYEDIGDLIALLQHLQKVDADIYKEPDGQA